MQVISARKPEIAIFKFYCSLLLIAIILVQMVLFLIMGTLWQVFQLLSDPTIIIFVSAVDIISNPTNYLRKLMRALQNIETYSHG